MSSTPGEVLGLVADDPDRIAVEAGEADDDVLGEVLVDLEELAVVDDQRDHVAHVVGLLRVGRDDRVERLVHALGVVVGLDPRRHLEVVERQEADQVADVLEARLLVLGGEVGDPRLRVVGHRPAQLLELDLLAGDRLDHLGAGDEHVRGLLDHEDEVGHRRRVDGAARARAHDRRDLRDHPGALDVADEDVAVGAERDDALLDPRPAGVVEPDHRRPDLRGEVHDLAHLLRHHLAERAAEDGEVLAEDEHRPAVDRPVAGDHGVAVGPLLVHVELVRAVADEGVELLERARVEQLLDPLARGQLALRVLLLDRLLGGRVDRLLAQLAQVGELLLEGLGVAARARGADSMRPSRARPRIARVSAATTRGSSSAAGAAAERRAIARSAAARVVAARRGRPASAVWHTQAARISRDSSGICSPARPLGAAAVVALARAQQPAADVLGDPGAAGEPVAGLVVLGPRRAASAASRSARRLRRTAGRDVDRADLVQHRRLAGDLALGAVEAEPDRGGERVGGGRLGVLARRRAGGARAPRPAAAPRCRSSEARLAARRAAPSGEGASLGRSELIEQALERGDRLGRVRAGVLGGDPRPRSRSRSRRARSRSAPAQPARAERQASTRSGSRSVTSTATGAAAPVSPPIHASIRAGSSASSQSSGADLTSVRLAFDSMCAGFGRRRRDSCSAVAPTLEERAALVLAEHVAHRVADLADRGVGGERLADRVQQVAVAAGDLAQRPRASPRPPAWSRLALNFASRSFWRARPRGRP